MINQWQASRIGVLLDQEVWALKGFQEEVPQFKPFGRSSFPQIHYKKSQSLELSGVFLVFFWAGMFHSQKFDQKTQNCRVCEVGEGRVSVSGLEMSRHRRDDIVVW